MKDKIKNISIIAIFLALIFGFGIGNLFYDAGEVLKSERRVPEAFPKLNFETLANASFMDKYEDYLLDNFAFRDSFRKIKSAVMFNVFRQKDNGSVYEVGGVLSKYEKTMSEKSVLGAARKFEKLRADLFPEQNVYMAVIPDKNYFLAAKNGYPSFDYDEFVKLLRENTPNITYIDLFDTLEIGDYYKTDLHWNQSKILPVIARLSEKMGFEAIGENDYTLHEMKGFFGNYYGQYARPMKAETLTYLTSDVISGAKVYLLNEKTFEYESMPMYDENDFLDVDPYDIFLHGPCALIKIENPSNESGKRLILFRDSFGSSASPLMAAGYSEIYVVDLRYIYSNLIEKYIEFAPGDDVLFMYNTQVLNNSEILKVNLK